MAFYQSEPAQAQQEDTAAHLIFVPVIASYNSSGQCRPLYFRFQYQDGTYSDIAIDRVLSCQSRLASIFFTCSVTVGEVKTQVVLQFHRKENKWSIVFG